LSQFRPRPAQVTRGSVQPTTLFPWGKKPSDEGFQAEMKNNFAPGVGGPPRGKPSFLFPSKLFHSGPLQVWGGGGTPLNRWPAFWGGDGRFRTRGRFWRGPQPNPKTRVLATNRRFRSRGPWQPPSGRFRFVLSSVFPGLWFCSALPLGEGKQKQGGRGGGKTGQKEQKGKREEKPKTKP